ncbi:MAG: phospholipid carrier-dependent glycosyltransferase, partial [Cellvibrio sp.]|nr:phospholipid carrier-dependent glycosyltransferase [Cellvibrio sp.]
MKNLIHSIIKSKTAYVLIITLGLLVGLLQTMQPTFSNFTLMTPSGTSQPISFPGFMQSPEGGVYRLSGTLTMGKYSSSLL